MFNLVKRKIIDRKTTATIIRGELAYKLIATTNFLTKIA